MSDADSDENKKGFSSCSDDSDGKKKKLASKVKAFHNNNATECKESERTSSTGQLNERVS